MPASASSATSSGPRPSFDYEAQSSYSIRVRTTDAGGLWFEKAFTISVSDVDDRTPLTITGTAGDDQISVAVDGSRYAISLNGDRQPTTGSGMSPASASPPWAAMMW